MWDVAGSCEDLGLCCKGLNVNALCYLLQPPPGSVSSLEQQEQVNAQLERIHTLFRRQLAIPLMGKEVTSLSDPFIRTQTPLIPVFRYVSV